MKLKRIIGSAFVIARRDFTATVMSKAFLLFLLGPLFPVLMGAAFGGIGAKIEQETRTPAVIVVGSEEDFSRLLVAQGRLAATIPGQRVIRLAHARPGADAKAQREELLKQESTPVLGVLEGGTDRPLLTGAVAAEAAFRLEERLAGLCERRRRDQHDYCPEDQAAHPPPPTLLVC